MSARGISYFNQDRISRMGRTVNTLKECCVESIISNINHFTGKSSNQFSLPYELQETVLFELIGRKQVNDDVVKLFIHEDLQVLKLSGASTNVSDDTISTIQRIVKSLKSVSLFGCHFSDEVLQSFFEVYMSAYNLILKKYGQGLETLNISKAVGAEIGLQYLSSSMKCLILNRNSYVNDKHMIECLPKLPNLEELALLGCTQITQKSLGLLPKYNKNIQILNLSRCGVTTQTELIDIVLNCPNLIALKTVRLRQLTDAFLDAIGQKIAPQVQLLDFGLCSKMTEGGLIRLIQKCTNVTEFGLPIDSDAILNAITASCPNIEVLWHPKNPRITDQGLASIPNQLVHLKRLSIARAAVTGPALRNVLASCPELQELYSNTCSQLDESLFSALPVNPNFLMFEACQVNWLTPFLADELTDYAPNLADLNLSQSSPVDSTISPAAEGQTPGFQVLHLFTTKLRNLTSLVLQEWKLTDDDIIPIIQHGSRLRHVNLSGTKITGRSIIPLLRLPLQDLNVSNCTEIQDIELPNNFQMFRTYLDYLDISHCTQMTPRALEIIVSLCTNLHYFNMSNCLFEDVALQNIAPKICNLQSLIMAKMPNITDASICALANPESINNNEITSYTKVQIWNIAGCERVSDEGVIAVLKAWKLLTTIHLAECKQITEAILPYLSPKMQLVSLTNTRISKEAVLALGRQYPHFQIHYFNK